MDPIGIDEILGRERYGTQRDVIRRRVAEYKRARRVSVGPHLTFVFEDAVTVWWQIQEMLWVEQVTDLDAIRAELAVYNGMLPGKAELSATLLIEIENQAQVALILNRLVGIDECVALHAGDAQVRATFEPDRQTADKVSAVQYVRFPIDAAMRRAITADLAPLALVVDHPHYREHATLPAAVRDSLARELRDPRVLRDVLAGIRDAR